MMKKLQIQNFWGYFDCKGSYGEYMSTCNDFNGTFERGVHVLYGDVDSAAWAISYTISMYRRKNLNFILDDTSCFFVDDIPATIEEVKQYSYYLDESNPMFASKKAVCALVERGLRKSGSDMTAKQICDLFQITPFRFERPLRQVGNERFRCMAAMGYAYGKSIFCFPWMSKAHVQLFGRNIMDVLKVLEMQDKIVLLPTNFKFAETPLIKQTYFFEKICKEFMDEWGEQ